MCDKISRPVSVVTKNIKVPPTIIAKIIVGTKINHEIPDIKNIPANMAKKTSIVPKSFCAKTKTKTGIVTKNILPINVVSVLRLRSLFATLCLVIIIAIIKI